MIKGKGKLKWAVIATILVMCIAMAVISGCGANTDNGTGGGTNSDTLSGESVTYDVKIETSTSEPTTSTLTEILEEIRQTVIDVTTYTASGVGAGSGVIISSTSDADSTRYFAVTNHHVIEDGTSFYIDVLTIAADGSESTTTYEAKLVGSAPSRDIAVLQFDVDKGVELKKAKFVDDSDKVKVGTEVVAIGNPLGILGGTVTKGIISAKNREVTVDGIGSMTLMQTDAAINGGNSGGGLFDASTGKLVGIINSGYDSYNGESIEGLNFAISGNDALYAAESLISTYKESGSEISYGYVDGDTVTNLQYQTMTLYDNSSKTSYSTYLVAQVDSTESPFYEAWGGVKKAIKSITIGETTTDMTASATDNAYALENKFKEALDSIKAGVKVKVEYYDIYYVGLGTLIKYDHVDKSEVKTVEYTAEQYIYEPPISTAASAGVAA